MNKKKTEVIRRGNVPSGPLSIEGWPTRLIPSGGCRRDRRSAEERGSEHPGAASLGATLSRAAMLAPRCFTSVRLALPSGVDRHPLRSLASGQAESGHRPAEVDGVQPSATDAYVRRRIQCRCDQSSYVTTSPHIFTFRRSVWFEWSGHGEDPELSGDSQTLSRWNSSAKWNQRVRGRWPTFLSGV